VIYNIYIQPKEVNMTNKKKVATWHKNKTAPKKPKNNDVKASHWIESRARLTNVLNASGISQEHCQTMLPKSNER
jgi:hypothetical protein